MNSQFALFHTDDGKNDTIYNHWNFTSPHIWDDYDDGFWYSNNTQMLILTDEFVTGK